MSTFLPAHEIRVVAFNSLKLRLDHPELQEQWRDAVAEFAKYDAVLLSEVRASDKLWKKRAGLLVALLEKASGGEWTLHASEPSGPGVLEVHVLLTKSPLRVLAVETVSRASDTFCGHATTI